VADLKNQSVFDFTIEGLIPPKLPRSSDSGVAFSGNAAKIPPQTVAAGNTLKFKITLNLPKGYKLNKLAPVSYRVKATGQQNLIAAEHLNKRHRFKLSEESEGSLDVSIPVSSQNGKAIIELAVSYGYCRDGIGGLCKIKTARWQIPVEMTDSSERKIIQLEVAKPATTRTERSLPNFGLKKK